MPMKFDKLAVFDMDGVLTTHRSSWWAVNQHLGTDNTANLKAYRSGEISYREFILRDTEMWLSAKPDISRSDIHSIMSGIHLTSGIREATSYLSRRGFVVSIVSGGLSELSEMVCMEGRFDEVFTNRLTYDEEGQLLPGGEPVVLPGRKDLQVRLLQERYGIPPERTVAVGDAKIDLSMFVQTKYSISFNAMESEINAYSDIVIISNDMMDAATAAIALVERSTHGKN